jgi:hypothetical protein
MIAMYHRWGTKVPPEQPLTDAAADLAGNYQSFSVVPGNTLVESLALAADSLYRYESFDHVGSTPPLDISDFPSDTIANRRSSSGMWSVVEDGNVPVVELVDTTADLEAAFKHLSLTVVDGNLVVGEGAGAGGRKFVKSAGAAGATGGTPVQ